MFFRHLIYFQYTAPLLLPKLEAGLLECAIKPVGPLEFKSQGFVPPLGRDAEMMTHAVGNCIWLTLGTQERILPAGVVNEAVEKKIADYTAKEGKAPGGKIRRQFKEDVVHELLPRAFVKHGRINATIDLTHQFIAIDTSSRKQAERVVSEIRHALGSFPALPLNPEESPRRVMTSWLAGQSRPGKVELGDACVLQDAEENGSCWKGSRTDLIGDEINQHLESGKQATQLGLFHDGHLGFVLSEDLKISKLKFLDGAVESLDGAEHENAHAEQDARYAILSLEVAKLYETITSIFAAIHPRLRQAAA